MLDYLTIVKQKVWNLYPKSVSKALMDFFLNSILTLSYKGGPELTLATFLPLTFP